MKIRTVASICSWFLLLSLLVVSGTAQELRPADGKTHAELLVSTQWLSEHLSDPKLVIIDVGMPGMGSMGGMAPEYKEGHIPSARLLPESRIDSGTPPGAELLPDDQLKANLEAVGISDDSRVVIYSSHWFPLAARLLFTLDYIGFKNAAMLDGGMESWMREKRPVSTDAPKITPGTLTIHPHPEIVARMAQVQQLTSGSNANVVLVDARPMRRYEAGHLSGAVPVFWENNLANKDSMVLKSADELRKMYAGAGVTPGKKIVSYCEVGEQASYSYFIARYLGYDAAMYDGSYSEWNAAHQPVVKGDNPR